MKYPDVFRQEADIELSSPQPSSGSKRASFKQKSGGKDSISSSQKKTEHQGVSQQLVRASSSRPWWLALITSYDDEIDWDLVMSYAVVVSFLVGMAIFARFVVFEY